MVYRFIIEQNIREIQHIEVIAEDEEDAYENIFENNYSIIWRKTIDSEGMRIIRQFELEDSNE